VIIIEPDYEFRAMPRNIAPKKTSTPMRAYIQSVRAFTGGSSSSGGRGRRRDADEAQPRRG
jgi:hypothetical protein